MVSFLNLLACSNSGLNQLPDPSPPTADTAALVDCPWVGAWSLQGVACSSFPVDDWFDDYAAATAQITTAPSGGCDVALTLTAPSCEETVAWHLSAPAEEQSAFTNGGVTACVPTDCTFGDADAPCTPGDRVTPTQSIAVDVAAGALVLTGPLAHTAPNCTLEVVTTWMK